MAARAAITIAKLELGRSAAAEASGGMNRAEELLGDIDDPQTSAEGRAAEALDYSLQSHSAATVCGDPGLIALALVYMGFYNISLGNVEEGISQQNHAAAIALSSNVDPIFGSLVYCSILWSCRTYPDWSRARQWSEGFDTWCEASFATIPGACHLHRAEILGAQHDLNSALEAITATLPKLTDEEAWALGDGYRVRGDIRAMIGDLEGARQDYSAAYAAGWDAEPGNAFLLAETGKTDVALAALDRVLGGASWFHIQRRGILPAHKARIAAVGGLRDTALDAIGGLDAQAAQWCQPAAHALVNEARYHLSKDAESISFLRLARQLWTSAGIDYHAARVCLELAAAQIEAGNIAAAQVEIAAARRTAARIGSPRILAAADEMQRTALLTLRSSRMTA